MGFPGSEGEDLVLGLDREGFAVSSGATCSSGVTNPSHVLLAMGQSHVRAHASLRFSLGAMNDREQLERVIEAVARLTGLA